MRMVSKETKEVAAGRMFRSALLDWQTSRAKNVMGRE
jgi:hypothetical protein